MSFFDPAIEQALYTLVTEKVKPKNRLNIKRYQISTMYVYNPTIITQLLKAGKFKDIGNVYDYHKLFPPTRPIGSFELISDFKRFQRIAISKKLNTAMIYSVYEYAFYCIFMIDIKKLKKFAKIVKPILQQDFSQVNIFNDIDFKCKPSEYIEISKAGSKSDKPVDVIKKRVSDENLVFEEKSILSEVINDITSFFSEETKDLYKKMDIPYKRGAILHGPPGTGKSALIREIIRRIGEKVSKIVINPNISFDITHVLSSLLRALNGRSAIIIIEDMDSLINTENRSEFLNLLDGIDVKSGSYIIGTTNYPERIDPAFVNRSGRFDRTYKIDNPSYKTRLLFFESKNLNEVFDTKENISKLFAKYTKGLPMASLKEIITSTKYILANNPKMSIEEAIKISSSKIKGDKERHFEANMNYIKSRNDMRFQPQPIDNNESPDFDDIVDDEEESIGYIKIVKKDNADVEFSLLS